MKNIYCFDCKYYEIGKCFTTCQKGNKPKKITEGKHNCKDYTRSNRRDRGTNFQQS